MGKSQGPKDTSNVRLTWTAVCWSLDICLVKRHKGRGSAIPVYFRYSPPDEKRYSMRSKVEERLAKHTYVPLATPHVYSPTSSGRKINTQARRMRWIPPVRNLSLSD